MIASSREKIKSTHDNSMLGLGMLLGAPLAAVLLSVYSTHENQKRQDDYRRSEVLLGAIASNMCTRSNAERDGIHAARIAQEVVVVKDATFRRDLETLFISVSKKCSTDALEVSLTFLGTIQTGATGPQERADEPEASAEAKRAGDAIQLIRKAIRANSSQPIAVPVGEDRSKEI